MEFSNLFQEIIFGGYFRLLVLPIRDSVAHF